jgi:Glycosyltransferase family 20/Na+/H+ antiporter 1
VSRHRSHQPLPSAELVADRLFSTLERFLHVEAVSGIVLLVAALSALRWANSPAADSYQKEFVAAQDSADPGVLILSSLVGAARELTSAVQVNPYDTRGIAQAIQLALTMPLAERRERHHALLEILRRNDIHAWHRSFLERLSAVCDRTAVRSAG